MKCVQNFYNKSDRLKLLFHFHEKLSQNLEWNTHLRCEHFYAHNETSRFTYRYRKIESMNRDSSCFSTIPSERVLACAICLKVEYVCISHLNTKCTKKRWTCLYLLSMNKVVYYFQSQLISYHLVFCWFCLRNRNLFFFCLFFCLGTTVLFTFTIYVIIFFSFLFKYIIWRRQTLFQILCKCL